MDQKVKKFLPLIVLGVILFVGFGIYIVVSRLGMATYNLPEDYTPAGFWLGLWQGMIILISFITSLFDKTINIYQAGNTGVTYNLGYLIGLMIALGGGAKASNSNKQ